MKKRKWKKEISRENGGQSLKSWQLKLNEEERNKNEKVRIYKKKDLKGEEEDMAEKT